MRAAWRITGKDLRLRIRDRSALILGVIAPLALAFIFNVVFGGAFGEESIATIGFVDEDGGEIAIGFGDVMTALAQEGIIDVEEIDDADTLRSRVDDGDLGAGVVLPRGLTQSVLAGQPATVTVVGSVDAPTVTAIAEGIATAFATSVGDTQRAVAAVLAGGGGDPNVISAITEAAGQIEPLVTVGPIEAVTRVLDPATFFSASMAVFFLFFLVQFGVMGLLEEEQDGTLFRLEAAPIPRWAIPLGKAQTSFMLGLIALAVLATATTVLMGANWGDPLALAVLFIAVVLAATSLVGVVAGFARTPDAAGNLVSIIAVAMGLVGGSFFPVAGGNRAMEVASLATPHSWFMRGVGDLQAGGGLESILPSIGALAAFSVVGSVLTVLALRRRFG